MNHFLKNDTGVLTFEWILIITILVIGVISGLSAVRDGLDIELVDIAVAVDSVDQGFFYYPMKTQVYFNQPGDTMTDNGIDPSTGVVDPGSIGTIGTTGQTYTSGWHMTAGVQHNPINQECTGQETIEIHTKKPRVH